MNEHGDEIFVYDYGDRYEGCDVCNFQGRECKRFCGKCEHNTVDWDEYE